jgi:hypothetical protein
MEQNYCIQLPESFPKSPQGRRESFSITKTRINFRHTFFAIEYIQHVLGRIYSGSILLTLLHWITMRSDNRLFRRLAIRFRIVTGTVCKRMLVYGGCDRIIVGIAVGLPLARSRLLLSSNTGYK